MAYLISTTTGNWTSASTWNVANGTNFLDSRAVSTALTTTPVGNTAFTWATGAPTIEGVAVQLSLRTTNPSGTITLQLFNSTGATVVASLTVNVSDIASTFGAVGSTWAYFKFASPVTLANSTNYQVRLSTSIASQVNCYASATTNWSYMLVTSTTGTPAANDSLIITGTHTAAGSISTITVTMDNTSATQFKDIFISNSGILSFGTTASTNYVLNTNGAATSVFIVGYGGQLRIGTAGTPMPATSTATITLNCASALSTFINVFGTFTAYNATYANTGGSQPQINRLAVDENAGDTTSTLENSGTWKSGDQIAVASTTRTAGQHEIITLSADQSGTAISHGAYVNAHGGDLSTSVAAHAVNITRNIIVRSGSTTFRSNVQVQANATFTCYGVRFQNVGTGITATTAGVGVAALTANSAGFNFYYNVITNTTLNSTTLSGTGLFTTNTLVAVSNVDSNIFYGLAWTAASTPNSIFNLGTYNVFMGNYASTTVCTGTLNTNNYNIFTSNTASTAAYGAGFTDGTFGWTFYSNSAAGLQLVATTTLSDLTGFIIWRNGTTGLVLAQAATTFSRSYVLLLNFFVIFGNGTQGIAPSTTVYYKVYIANSTIYGGTTLVQPIGFNVNTQIIDNIYFATCNLGLDTNSNSSPHSTSVFANPNRFSSVIAESCTFSGTEISGQTAGYQGANTQNQGIISYNHNNTGTHKQWLLNGTISGDSTDYFTTSPSLRLSPLSGTNKLSSPIFRVPFTANGAFIGHASGSLNLAIKKSSTNLMTYTEDISNAAWLSTAPAVTRTTNVVATTDPIGGSNADKMTEATTSSPQNIQQSIAASVVTPGIGYYFSIYLKAAERQYARVSLGTSALAAGVDLHVDLSNGLGVGAQFGTATLTYAVTEDAGNGWWRCWVGCSFAASAIIFPQVQIRNTFQSNTNYAGTLNNGIYIWGAMLHTDTITPYNYPLYEPVLTTPTNTPYNGTPPRLMRVGSYNAPVVGDYEPNPLNSLYNSDWTYYNSTYTGTIPPIEVNAGGVAEYYIDCDGTQGWINIDDIVFTPTEDSKGTKNWASNGPYIEADFRKGQTNSAYAT